MIRQTPVTQDHGNRSRGRPAKRVMGTNGIDGRKRFGYREPDKQKVHWEPGYNSPQLRRWKQTKRMAEDVLRQNRGTAVERVRMLELVAEMHLLTWQPGEWES